MCASIAVVEMSKRVIVIMSAHPHGGMPTTEKIRPTDLCLINIGAAEKM